MNWIRRHRKSILLASLTVITYWAAINRTQSLPWAAAALLTATLLTGFVWPRWMLRKLDVVRTGPQHATEGDFVKFSVEVINHGFFPCFMIEITDQLPFSDTAQDTASAGKKALGIIAHIPGHGRRQFEVSVFCEKRGLYQIGPVALSSSFPLGLTETHYANEQGTRMLTVYPDIFTILSLPLFGSPTQIHRGSYMLPDSTGAAEFSGLREYRRGDNPRHIHWPTTARLNELMIKEFEPLASACITVVLDQSSATNVGQGKHSSFEYAVRIAGSIACFAKNNDIPIRLVGEGNHILNLPRAIGERHYRNILDELAIIEADGNTDYSETLQKTCTDCQAGETIILFLSEFSGQHSGLLTNLATLQSRGCHLIAIVFSLWTFSSKPEHRAESHFSSLTKHLAKTGIRYINIERVDDLMRLFNS